MGSNSRRSLDWETGSSTARMRFADHQGAARNMTGIGDVRLSRCLPRGGVTGAEGRRCGEKAGCPLSSLSLLPATLPRNARARAGEAPALRCGPAHPRGLFQVSRPQLPGPQGWSGSPWGESVLPTQLLCGTAGWPRARRCAPARRIWPRSPHLHVGTRAL
uniref:Uncharacterized protein n=1 Tax=Myotis myotis TaxID=51298 RepID=A0A7J7R9H8_MYOMY|nr:hypothetical protein mMyoMyo1_010862 [Myotis myotis]